MARIILNGGDYAKASLDGTKKNGVVIQEIFGDSVLDVCPENVTILPRERYCCENEFVAHPEYTQRMNTYQDASQVYKTDEASGKGILGVQPGCGWAAFR